jgi:hypothetical protein
MGELFPFIISLAESGEDPWLCGPAFAGVLLIEGWCATLAG